MNDTYFSDMQKKRQQGGQPQAAGAPSVTSQPPPHAGPGYQMKTAQGNPSLAAGQKDSYAPAMGANGYAKSQSTGAAGSGFVNLSQMLDLNKESGAKSAADLSNSVSGQANKATGQLNGMVNDFNTQANKSGASGQAYNGPGSLSDMSGYDALSKSLLGAGESAGNLAKGGQGIAAEIGKQTGLSPTQSGAGAFYAGVNNGMIKRTGNDYKDLGNTLDKANTDSAQTASLAKQRIAGDQQTAADKAKHDAEASQSGGPMERTGQMDARDKQYGRPDGGVAGYGDKDAFANAAAGRGGMVGGGLSFGGGPAISAADLAKQMEAQLGVSSQELAKALQRMSTQEYQDFMINGIIPSWMQTGPNAGANRGNNGTSKGTMGGWNSPFLQGSDNPDNGGRALDTTMQMGKATAQLAATAVGA